MGELTKENVLEFWNNATLEEQRKYLERVFSLIDSELLSAIWLATKDEIKRENPDLIIRIIKEKQMNGKIYISGLWKAIPEDVQENKIEEVLQLYKKSPLAIKRIWLMETAESVRSSKASAVLQIFKDDKALLEKLGLSTNCFSKETIDQIVNDMKQTSYFIIIQKDYIEDEDIKNKIREFLGKYKDSDDSPSLEEFKGMQDLGMKHIMSKIPTDLISYFFEQMAKKNCSDIDKFWGNMNQELQQSMLFEVLEKLKNDKKIQMEIWNSLDLEIQIAKVKEALRDEKGLIVLEIAERELVEKIIIEEGCLREKWRIMPKWIQEKYLRQVMDNENIEEIWSKTANEVQNDNSYIYILIVLKQIKNSTPLKMICDTWSKTSIQVQKKYLMFLLKKIDGYENGILEIVRKTSAPITEEIIEYIFKTVSPEEFDKIINRINSIEYKALKKIQDRMSYECGVKVVIKNAAELSVEAAEELNRRFYSVRTRRQVGFGIKMQDDNVGYYQTSTYRVRDYIKCRDAIDEVLDGIDLSENLDDPDREKRIFGEVIKRLANHISYDYETLKKLDDNTATYEEKIRCANMSGGLINKTCVCSGYSETVRNVFACCGIEVRYISGNNIAPKRMRTCLESNKTRWSMV